MESPEIHPPCPGEAKKKSKSLPSFGRSGLPLDYSGIFKRFEQEDRAGRRGHSSRRKKSPSSDNTNSSSSLSDTSCSSVEFLTPQKWFSQGSKLGFLPKKHHASTESLSTRRERLEAVKARVAAERKAKCQDSSSEEETMEERTRLRRMPRYHSDEVLGRSRSARTERYLKRRSQDEHSLRQVPQPFGLPDENTVSAVEHSKRLPGFTWKDSDAYEEPAAQLPKNSVFQVNQNCESAKENRPDNSLRKNNRSNSLCIFPAQSSIQDCPRTHPFRGNQCKPLSVKTSYGIGYGHPSPCDSGLSSQSLASSPSIFRAPTPPPRSPQPKPLGHDPARHFQVRPTQRPVSCSLETVFDSGRYSKSPTLTLQSETCSSGRSSPWVQRMVANYEKKQQETSSPVKFLHSTPIPQPSNVYSYTDVPPALQNSPSGSSTVYSYTDQAPSIIKKQYDTPMSSYMSDSQLIAQRRSSIAVDKPTSPSWRVNPVNAKPNLVEARWQRCETPPLYSTKSSYARNDSKKSLKNRMDTPLENLPSPSTSHQKSSVNQNVTPPAPPVRRESSSYSAQRHRRCSENFEDALQELEDIYNSLKLNTDEDLLDRAERRDLPCAHQLMRQSSGGSENKSNHHVSEPESDVPRFLNGYALARSSSDGVGHCHRPQQRTPPNRRSAVPDKVADDMANRKLQKLQKMNMENNNPMSYMLYSPVFTPTLTVDEFFKDFHSNKQPDVEYDDFNYRKYSQSDGARVQAPHPPFGIPLNPLSKSSNSDYLKTKVANTSPKPIFKSKSTLADPVRDDLAYRNLRKDQPVVVNGHDPSIKALNKNNTKNRAVRSLSANFSALLNLSRTENQEFEKAQSMSDLIAALEKESEKWEQLSNDGESDIRPSGRTHCQKDMGSSTETLTETRSPKRENQPLMKPTSARSPTPPVPRRRSLALSLKNHPHSHDFWSDSDIQRQNSGGPITPIDDTELDDLLSSLARDASALVVPEPTGSSAQDNLFNSLAPDGGTNANQVSTDSASSRMTLGKLATLSSCDYPKLASIPAMTDAAPYTPNRLNFRGASGSRNQQGDTGLSDTGERMAKYKEERRRQIHETVREKQRKDHEGLLGTEPPIIRRSLRSKQQQQPEALNAASATPHHGASDHSDSAFSSGKRYIARDRTYSDDPTFLSGKVRLTKAARLRAEATSSHIQASQVLKNGLTHQGSLKKVPSIDGDVKPNSPVPMKNSATDVNYNVAPRNADHGGRSAESDGSCDLSQSKGEKFKDKSSKRKSNLNRATVPEGHSPVPSDVPNPRRPRRLRLTSSSSGSDKIDVKSQRSADVGQPLLEHGVKSSDSQSDSKSATAPPFGRGKSASVSKDRETSPKKKVTALKKPDIPVVFRQRSLTPPLTSDSRLPSSPSSIEKVTQTPPCTGIDSTPAFRRDDKYRWSTNSRNFSKHVSERSVAWQANSRHSVKHQSVSSLSSEKLSDGSFVSISPATELEDEDNFFTPPETLGQDSPRVAKTSDVIVSTSPVIYTVSVTTTATVFTEEESIVPSVAAGDGKIPGNSSKNMQALTVGDTRCTKEINFKDLASSCSSHRVEEIVECETRGNDAIFSKKPFPILKRKSLEEKREDIQGILRFRSRSDSTDEDTKRPPSSILKKRGSAEEKEIASEVHPILKRQSTEESDSNSPVHSILKHKSLDENPCLSEPKPILKKKISMEEIPSASHMKADPKPILKKRSSIDEQELDDKPRRSILKKMDDDFTVVAPKYPSFRKSRRDSDEIQSDSSLAVPSRNSSGIVRRLSMDNNYVTANRDDKGILTSILKKRSTETPENNQPNLAIDGGHEKENHCENFVPIEMSRKSPAVVPSLFTSVAEKRSQFKVTSAEEPPFQNAGASKMMHRRKNPRYRTQPITVGEIQAMDNLESVQSFRSRVLKNASLSVFEEKERANKTCNIDDKSKRTEFPQHYKPAHRKDRRSSNRYRTLPITLEEIHDAEKTVTTATAGDDLEKDPSKLSVSEKARLFATKMQEKKTETPFRTPMRRSLPRKSRFQTQPVTSEEVRIISGLMKSLQKPPEKEDALDTLVSKQISGTPCSATIAAKTETKVKLNVLTTSEAMDAAPKVSKPTEGKKKAESSSEESSSGSEEEEDGDDTDSKKVLTGGQSHILINSYGSTQEGGVRDTKKITNLAVQRKLNASLRKKEEMRNTPSDGERLKRHEILASASTSVLSNSVQSIFSHREEDDSTPGFPKKSLSQPMIDGEKDNHASVTIRDRLAALQKNGEENWKKRVSKSEDVGDTKTNAVTEESLVSSRKSQLEFSSSLWQNRVETKDAEMYTVAGKMGQNLSSSPVTPVLDRKKKTPLPSSIKSNFKPPANAVMVMPAAFLPLSKSKSVPVAARDFSSEKEVDEEEEDIDNKRVLVPRADNETFSSFFDSTASISDMKVEISDEFFNEIASHSHQFLVQKKTVKMMQRRHVATRNPIKALASRSDLREGYVEEKSGVAEMELKRIKIEEMAKNSNKCAAAVAGLVSTEDFKSVSLRKSGTETSLSTPLILMQVKGRRHVQTRLVEPFIKSVNHGDSFVLVTPEAVFCWLGKYSNVIERSKVSEVASMVLLKKEIAFKETAEVITLDEEKTMNEKHVARFFELLGGTESDCLPAGLPEEDENYEAFVIDTNLVYELLKDELIPHDDFWGHMPKIEMLNANKVFVFDFGSEMYVWSGKQSAMGDRKIAMRLAQQLWDHGYDYTECDINPICPELNSSEARYPRKDAARPKWATLQRIYQNMEPVLFREKFLDWPNMARIIQVKGQEAEGKAEALAQLLKPCDAKELLMQKASEPDTILEGSHLGRGLQFWDAEEKRLYEITTLAVKMWHVMEYEHLLLPRSSWGQFHMGDTYVFRWQYRITTLGREFTGKKSRHSFGGRDRCAYFFWQGKESTITEKGACALMTVELDEERGPHLRVVQGKEPPCFLNLFDGEMVVYIGKREVEETNTPGPFKFFMLRGEVSSEVMLVEIERSANSLRSRSSFALMNIDTGLVFLWHGAKALPHTRENIKTAVTALLDKKPLEMFFASNIEFQIEELEEGSENTKFWQALNGRQEYFSLLNSTFEFHHTPRLFHLSSVSGSFEATEILCAFRSENHIQAFPFLQSELYGADQPALFLLDNEYEVYLWQGWWPEGTEETDNVSTGSAQMRWNINRRCAMETTLHYCQEKSSSNPPQAFLISAGIEPLEFTNLFPEWVQRDDVTSLQTKTGKFGDKVLVKEILERLTRTHYPISQLQTRPLPEGVDPLRLEVYIAEEEFLDLFSMTKEDFYKMPSWKQNDYKKNLNLF